jgi:hypothetical protein
MGMPRKGSRVIDVDGKKFRWTLHYKRAQYRWDDPMPARTAGMVTIQEDHERPGHVLQQNLSWLRGSSITPDVMRQVIRQALQEGWNPASRERPSLKIFGKSVDIEGLDTKIAAIRFVMDQ